MKRSSKRENDDDKYILDANVNGKKATYNVTIGENSSNDTQTLTASDSGSRLPQVYGDISQTTPGTTPGDDSKSLLLKKGPPNGFDDAAEVPKDRYNLVYLIFIINGISTLMPWNMFITAKTYFVDYKFGGSEEEYAKNFLSYLGICSQVPNLLLNLINAFAHSGDSLTIRIIISLLVLILMMLMTIVLAMIDSVSWPEIFFVLTMLTVVICNCAVGVYQNCVYGMAANFPMKYTGAVVLGSNISGTLTSFISLISMLVTPNLKMAAIYYFTTALFVVLLSFDSYFLLPHCVWVQMFNIFFVFFVSLTVFPAMQVDVVPTDSSFIFAGKYFASITCFISFNLFAMIGNLAPHWFKNPGPKFLWIPILLRGLLIPYFFFSNYRPSCRTWPVLFGNDYVYTFMGVVLGFTSGYFSSLVMMYTPKLVDKGYARIAAMLATFFLILGIVCGINNTLLIAFFVEKLGPVAANSTSCHLG
uniref:Equilibrative nucleoside transporter 3 n=1 Tax=Romanomermis culicivorax TaxID=13658 RepID=A0A915ITK3_ROMCU